MKFIKKFGELNEGKDRYTIKDNMASVGDAGLPQFWTTSPDYTKVDHDKDPQEPGVDPEQIIPQPGNGYSYLTDIEDHVDDKQVKKLMEPHIKKFNDFGFDPSEKTKTDKK